MVLQTRLCLIYENNIESNEEEQIYRVNIVLKYIS